MRNAFLILTMAAAFAATALAADASAGKAVYDRSCKNCHGANGTANPAISKMMKVDIKDLKSADVQSMSDADLKKVITEGKGKMKPMHVEGADLNNLVAYIKTMK